MAYTGSRAALILIAAAQGQMLSLARGNEFK